jgi:hypothetical protein
MDAPDTPTTPPAGPPQADARAVGLGLATGATPQFGPRGYLPDRAARRARKIVLRAPLGMQWVVASLVAGAVVLAAGLLILGRGSAAPGAPWIPVGVVEALPASSRDVGTGLLVTHVGGRVRAFAAPDGVAYCTASNRLEHPDGRVWALTGRGYAGVGSLVPVPTLTYRGEAYLDPTARAQAPEPLPESSVPGC